MFDTIFLCETLEYSSTRYFVYILLFQTEKYTADPGFPRGGANP